MTRTEILNYVREKYGTLPEYPWAKYPGYAILRHSSNCKWYGAIMNVPRRKLGLDGGGEEEVINLKCDPGLICGIVGRNGILPGYHMNKEHWITILLGYDRDPDDTFNLVDISFNLTNKGNQ